MEKTMPNEDQSLPATSSPNRAVTRCSDAFTRVYKAEMAKGSLEIMAIKRAGRAFKNEMPTLIGCDDIRDFLACVARGILLDAIDPVQASRLISSARAALKFAKNDADTQKPNAA
jgi:hypothetical protein